MTRPIIATLVLLALAAGAALAKDLEAEYDRTARRGAPRDHFPVLDDPELTPAAKAKGLRDDDPVIGLVVGKEAKAYPISVMGVLRGEGLPENRIGVMGYGELRPIAPNTDPKSKALNRRVEIYVVPRSAIALVDSQTNIHRDTQNKVEFFRPGASTDSEK